MEKNQIKNARRSRRRRGIRKRVLGTADRPRLSVFRSSKHLYAQLIDDMSGSTLAAVSSVQAKLEKGCNCEAAKTLGGQIAQRAQAKGLKQVTFDRNGFRYHGRVKSLADAAREGGLEF